MWTIQAAWIPPGGVDVVDTEREVTDRIVTVTALPSRRPGLRTIQLIMGIQQALT